MGYSAAAQGAQTSNPNPPILGRKASLQKSCTHPRILESSGNVFADLGFPPDEAVILGLRAELLARLRETLAERGWTQTEAAEQLGIGQSRVSDLVRGKHEKFSLDMLVRLTARAGGRVELAVR